MKTKRDFVSNSSSVSYIVSFNQDMAEWGKIAKTSDFQGNTKNKRIFELLAVGFAENGEGLEKNSNDIYIKQYDFSKKSDSKFDDSFEQPIEEVDFGSLSDDEVWAYIYGEYLVNARLGVELKGFGVIQVSRDEEVLAHKKNVILERKTAEGSAP